MALEIFRCDICPKLCDTQGELNRHQKRHTKPLRCEVCHKGFPYRTELKRHVLSKHRVGNDRYHCPVDQCRSTFERKDNLNKHVRKYHASTLSSFKINTSLVNDTKKASSRQDARVPPVVHSLKRIYSISMFMQAASSGDFSALDLMMRSGFTTKTRADDGSTALHCAARSGQAKMVRNLIEKGADVKTKNGSNRSPLHEGFLSNDLDTVKALVANMADDWYSTEKSDTERHLARTKNIQIFELYAQHSKARFGRLNTNQIFNNAMRAKNDTLVAALLDHPDLDVNGHGDIVERLLHFNFDINYKDSLGRTPLQLAAMLGRSEVVKLLVDKWSADLSSRDCIGQTLLQIAAFYGQWECVHVILEHIAWKSSCDTTDFQPVNTEFCIKDVIFRLLNHPDFEDPNLLQKFSERNLMYSAVEKGQCEAIAVLLSHEKIDVNACDHWGFSPLHFAVNKSRIEAAKLLLQQPQIDMNRKSRNGKTVLGYARSCGRQEMVDLLLLHGAIDDEAEDAPTVTTEGSNSLTAVQAGHMHNTPLQPEHDADPNFDFDTSTDGVPSFSDVSDVEDDMMEQGFVGLDNGSFPCLQHMLFTFCNFAY